MLKINFYFNFSLRLWQAKNEADIKALDTKSQPTVENSTSTAAKSYI
jgi:hypothetical protein